MPPGLSIGFSVREESSARHRATQKCLFTKHGYMRRYKALFQSSSGFPDWLHRFLPYLLTALLGAAQHYSDPFVRRSHPTSLLSLDPGYAVGLGAT